MRYDKGRKDASRARILDVATRRFRRDGIAATGLTGLMSEAGLTNGAFYPHFASKADLVGESLKAALDDQAEQLTALDGVEALEAMIQSYLSPEHRDGPEIGCPSAALLPEIARLPIEARAAYTERFEALVDRVSHVLPDMGARARPAAMGIFSVLVGALQMARAVSDPALSDELLAAGARAAMILARS
jgi:TetR/AcrR family transcriptional regulator, transcriptional repressor for nem operon